MNRNTMRLLFVALVCGSVIAIAVVWASRNDPPIKLAQVAVTCVDGSRDNIVCGDASGDIHVCTVADGRSIATIHHGTPVTTVAFVMNSSELLVGDSAGQVVRYDWMKGTARETVSAHTSAVTRIRISPTGDSLLTEGAQDDVKVWNMTPMTMRATISRDIPGHEASACFGRDGREIITASLFEDQPRLWDADTGQKLEAMQSGSRRVSYSAAVSSSLGLLATGTTQGSVVLWDIGERRQIGEVHPFPMPIVHIAFTEDGRELAVAETSGALFAPRRIQVYDCKTLSLQRGLRQALGSDNKIGTTCICYVVDRRIIVTGHSDGTLRLWRY